MDLSAVIASFASDVPVTRSGAVSYGTDGRPTVANASTFTIRATVQPLSGRDLLRLPEGLRTEETLAVYTPTELKTVGAGQEPDTLTINGEDWQVQHVERWSELGGYFRVVVAKVGA